MILNINKVISVRLTDYGKIILKNYLLNYNISAHLILFSNDYIQQEIKKEYHEFQLWKFMEIFGKYCSMSSKQIIELNLIFIHDKK